MANGFTNQMLSGVNQAIPLNQPRMSLGQVFSEFQSRAPGSSVDFGGGSLRRTGSGVEFLSNGVIQQLGSEADALALAQNNPAVAAALQSEFGIGIQPQVATVPSMPGGRQVVPSMPGGRTPQVGVAGAERALQQGARQATQAALSGIRQSVSTLGQAQQQGISALQSGGQQATQAFERGAEGLEPFTGAGVQAANVQAALSGALGPQAQTDALANLQPVNEFLQQQGEQSILRQAAATGGLRGGNVQKDLIRFGQGLAGQTAQQQFENLSPIAQRGLTAAQALSGVRGQQGLAQMGTGQSVADLLAGIAQSQAGIQERGFGRVGDIALGTGQTMFGGRQRAGELLANQVGSTTSALSNLLAQQGQQGAGAIGGTASNVAGLLSGTGQTLGGQQADLGRLLANVAIGSIPGAQTSPAQFVNTQGNAEAAGQIASAAGNVMAAFSDVRLKENISQVGVLENGIGVYTWDWNEEGKKLAGGQATIGVLAQEVEAINPYLVETDESGYLKVNYEGLLNG